MLLCLYHMLLYIYIYIYIYVYDISITFESCLVYFSRAVGAKALC